jgi:aryl carrier-like protein
MPMLRAAKGTIQRAGTLQLYADQIEALYNESESVLPSDTPLSREYVTSALRSMMRDVMESSDLNDELDFFNQGMDSLQLPRLSAAIRSRLGASISPSVIYRNPSITLLTTQICQDTTADAGQDQTVVFQEMLQHYEEQIDHLALEPAEPSPESNQTAKKTVILTGSTGTVGSFVLAQLLDNPEVAHISCLNGQRTLNLYRELGILQRTRNLQRGIHTTLDPDRVTFLTADLTQPYYGLEIATSRLYYAKQRKSFTVPGQSTSINHCLSSSPVYKHW